MHIRLFLLTGGETAVTASPVLARRTVSLFAWGRLPPVLVVLRSVLLILPYEYGALLGTGA